MVRLNMPKTNASDDRGFRGTSRNSRAKRAPIAGKTAVSGAEAAWLEQLRQSLASLPTKHEGRVPTRAELAVIDRVATSLLAARKADLDAVEAAGTAKAAAALRRQASSYQRFFAAIETLAELQTKPPARRPELESISSD